MGDAAPPKEGKDGEGKSSSAVQRTAGGSAIVPSTPESRFREASACSHCLHSQAAAAAAMQDLHSHCYVQGTPAAKCVLEELELHPCFKGPGFCKAVPAFSILLLGSDLCCRCWQCP